MRCKKRKHVTEALIPPSKNSRQLSFGQELQPAGFPRMLTVLAIQQYLFFSVLYRVDQRQGYFQIHQSAFA